MSWKHRHLSNAWRVILLGGLLSLVLVIPSLATSTDSWVEVMFIGEIVEVHPGAPVGWFCKIRVDRVIHGSIDCSYVEIWPVDWVPSKVYNPPRQGDKVEVLGEVGEAPEIVRCNLRILKSGYYIKKNPLISEGKAGLKIISASASKTPTYVGDKFCTTTKVKNVGDVPVWYGSPARLMSFDPEGNVREEGEECYCAYMGRLEPGESADVISLCCFPEYAWFRALKPGLVKYTIEISWVPSKGEQEYTTTRTFSLEILPSQVKELYEVLKTYEIVDPYPGKYGDETFLTVFREFPNSSNPRHQVLYIEVSAATTEDGKGNLSNPIKYGQMSFAIDEDVAVLFPNIKVYIPAEKNHLTVNEVEPLPYYNPDKYIPMPSISDSSLIADTLKFIAGSLPILGGMILSSDWVSKVRRELLEPTIIIPKNSSQYPKTMTFSENEMDIIPVAWIPEKELFGLTEKGYESIVVKLPIVFPKKAKSPQYKVYIHGNYRVEMPWWSDPTGATIEYNEELDLSPEVNGPVPKTCINFDEFNQGDITGQTLHYDQVDFVAGSARPGGSVAVDSLAHSSPNGIALFGGTVTAHFKTPASRVSLWLGDWSGGTKITLFASDGELLEEISPTIGDFTYYEFSYTKKISMVELFSYEGAFDDFCFETEEATTAVTEKVDFPNPNPSQP